MTRLINTLKKSYIYIILALFYIPLIFGVMYSFQTTPKKGDISPYFNFSTSGWTSMSNDENILKAIITSAFIGVIVGVIVTTLSLLTVFGIWRSKSKTMKTFVNGTSNIPLINPDIITGLSLALTFGMMFGLLQRGDDGIERVIIGHSTMIIPFGITIMLPKSEKFKPSIMEASRDLGYGNIKTWFKTYFRYMIGLILVVFIISIAMSFDDFIITRTVSRTTTIGQKMYQGYLKPWVLALGTIILSITLTTSIVLTAKTYLKEKKYKRGIK